MAQKNENDSKKFAEDWMPVKNIANGAIQLDDGFLVTGVKVSPKNIFILDYNSQNNLIFNLRTFYDRISYEFWLIVTDRPVDLNQYISRLQLQFNEIQNIGVRRLISEDIRKAEMFMGREINVVDTEYYILFREKKPDIIAKRIQELISNLAGCGISARQTTNEDLRAMLDSSLTTTKKIDFPILIYFSDDYFNQY